MSTRPILMHAQSVQGVLAGRKSVTRRIVKPQPDTSLHQPRNRPRGPVTGFMCVGTDVKSGRGVWEAQDAHGPVYAFPEGRESVKADVSCPYGVPGDRLWVRETWARVPWEDGEGRSGHAYLYRADNPPRNVWDPERGDRWKPSIHMPKWACRLWLRVTDVRVERVQEISTEDVWAEGVQIPTSGEPGSILWRLAPSNPSGKVPASYLPGPRPIDFSAITGDDIARAFFADLWDTTNGSGAWERNDWVWVIDFERDVSPRAAEATDE